MGFFTRVVDPYNTMGAAQQQRTGREAARKSRRAEKDRVEKFARKNGFTLEAAAEYIAAYDDAVNYDGPRGRRASDDCIAISENPKNRKDWHRR